MEMCMPPSSLLPRAWDAHFLGASQDPRFMAEWKIFLYMDIKMRQQLVNSPFTPVPGSPLYRDGYDIAVAQLHCEEDRATWSAIRQRDGGGSGRVASSKQEKGYALTQMLVPTGSPAMLQGPAEIRFTVAARPACQRSASDAANLTHTMHPIVMR